MGLKPSQNKYTYTLAYPAEMGGTVFYVGKGTGFRVLSHEGEARAVQITSGGTQYYRCGCDKCQAIREIWKCGYCVQRKIIQDTTSEISLIRKLTGSKLLTNKQGVPKTYQKRSSSLTLEQRLVDPDVLAAADRAFSQRYDWIKTEGEILYQES